MTENSALADQQLQAALHDGARFRALASQRLDPLEAHGLNAHKRGTDRSVRYNTDRGVAHDSLAHNSIVQPDFEPSSPFSPLCPAAILVPIIMRQELTVLLTRRPEHMKDHAGQISFPGGKIEPQDDGPASAAMRETFEEVGIAPNFIEPLGFLDTYHLSTGFAIAPLVALLRPDFTLRLNHAEVTEAFEVPLRFLMDRKNFQPHSVEWQGKQRHFHAVTYQDYVIWGATAAMTLNLYERLSAK